MLAGVDTGFFFAMEEGNAHAIGIWNKREIATSAIVIYELQKNCCKAAFRIGARLSAISKPRPR